MPTQGGRACVIACLGPRSGPHLSAMGATVFVADHTPAVVFDAAVTASTATFINLYFQCAACLKLLLKPVVVSSIPRRPWVLSAPTHALVWQLHSIVITPGACCFYALRTLLLRAND